MTAIYEICREEGLSVDVASGGELTMALRAGFPGERIYMHGNNKSEAELQLAIEAGVGCIVIDSLDEVDKLERLLERPQRVLIRLTPGIKPSTHSYIQTGQLDSKFGFGLAEGVAAAAVERITASAKLELVGVHAHIGSQIFELEPFEREAEALAGFCADHLPDPEIVDLGGGLGIAYAASDEPPSIAGYVGAKLAAVRRHFGPGPRLLLEPGRSLVGNAGLTVYEVGTVKEIPGVRTYAAVDGGMSDNLRPMLYGSTYEALLANRAAEPAPDGLARHDRRNALRIGRHPDSRRCAAAPTGGGPADDAGDGRVRSRDGEQLQRRPAAACDLLQRRRRPRRRPPRELGGPGEPRCLSPRRPRRKRSASACSATAPSAAPSRS